MDYDFTLRYQLAEDDADHDDLVERLGAAGCDDALVGIGQPGRIALDFSREAVSADEALKTALSDVKRAIPTAKLIEALPDFVGLTGVADAIGVSRQNMRKLMLSYATGFPAPVHAGGTSVWHLADVIEWLSARGSYNVPAGLAEVAAINKQVNLIKETRGIRRGARREFRALVG